MFQHYALSSYALTCALLNSFSAVSRPLALEHLSYLPSAEEAHDQRERERERESDIVAVHSHRGDVFSCQVRFNMKFPLPISHVRKVLVV